MVRIEICGRLRRVEGPDRVAEARPVPLGRHRRIEPFGKVGQEGDGAADRLAQCLRREAGGQRIHGFDQRGLGRFLLGHHEVGMQHLDFRPEAFAAAGDDPCFAHGQEALEIVGAGVEIDQVQEAALVAHAHLVGLALAPAGNVVLHRRREGDDLAVHRLGHVHLPGPVDESGGPEEEHILHPRAGNLGDQCGQSRADAGQGGDVLEQGKENLWAHRDALYRQVAPLPPVDAAVQPDYMRPS